MVCFQPLKGYRARYINQETGKRPVVFSASQGHPDMPVVVPCGKCLGCLMTRAFFWSVRCTCESVDYDESYFLTLTYDKEHLPEGGELCRAHVQSFVKRLRYYFKDYKLRIFYCGEYGEKRHRPHYHMIVFGLPLNKEKVKYFPIDKSKRGNINYACPFLEKVWKLGVVRMGTFSANAASYVAQYTLKKHSPEMRNFLRHRVTQPFIGASNRPGLGYDFFMKYHTDIYRRKFFRPFPDKDITVHRIPYFDRLLEKFFKIEWFMYVELPRRRRMYDQIVKYHDAGFVDSMYNPLFDRDSEALYYKERKLLRSLQTRDDF